MIKFGFEQLIKQDTRVTKTSQTSIDHIYTNQKEKVIKVEVIESGISDHYPVFLSITNKLPKDSKKGHTCIKYRCLKKFMKEAYTADLSILPFNAIYCITDPDEAIDFLCKCLLRPKKKMFVSDIPTESKKNSPTQRIFFLFFREKKYLGEIRQRAVSAGRGNPKWRHSVDDRRVWTRFV